MPLHYRTSCYRMQAVAAGTPGHHSHPHGHTHSAMQHTVAAAMMTTGAQVPAQPRPQQQAHPGQWNRNILGGVEKYLQFVENIRQLRELDRQRALLLRVAAPRRAGGRGGGGDGGAVAWVQSRRLRGPRGGGGRRDLGLRLGRGRVRLRGDRRGGLRGLRGRQARGRAAVRPRRQEAEEADRAQTHPPGQRGRGCRGCGGCRGCWGGDGGHDGG